MSPSSVSEVSLLREGTMSAVARLRLKLGILAALILALVAALLFTPLGFWLGRGAGLVWQGFLNLPGIALARQQMESSQQGQRSSALKPDTETIHDLLRSAYTLQEKASYEEALRRYREALQLDEEYAPTHLALATLYLELGRTKEAISELEQAAQLDPTSAVAWGQLGRLYLQEKELDKAVFALQQATTLDPKEPRYRYSLGVAYHYRSYTDVENALEELLAAAELQPDQAEIYYHLAMTYMRRDDQGDEQRAIEAFHKTLELDPGQTEVYYYLGRLYLETNQMEAGVAAWREYVKVSPDQQTVEKVRGWLAEYDARAKEGRGE